MRLLIRNRVMSYFSLHPEKVMARMCLVQRSTSTMRQSPNTGHSSAKLLARSTVVREAYLGAAESDTTTAGEAARRRSAAATVT